MFERLFRGIGGQMLRSFLIVIIISIGVLSFIIQQISFQRINEIASLISRNNALRLAPLFVDHYDRAGSWDDAQYLVEQFDQPVAENLTFGTTLGLFGGFSWNETMISNRIILTDVDSRVIADNEAALLNGQSLPTELETQAIPLEGKMGTIGKLVFVSEITPAFIKIFRLTVSRIITWGGLLAAATAFLVSVYLSRHIARPVLQLNSSATQLSTGETITPLPVTSKNEIGQLTQTFNEMAQELEKQKRLRQQMIADIAHELRTPLSIMQLNVEALEDGLQPPQETASYLHTEISTLTRLIDDLRLLSLADEGGLYLESEIIDPASFLPRLVQAWQVKAHNKQINLHLDMSSELPFIKADQGRLAQVMNNLISNALCYVPVGGEVIIGGKESGTEIILWVSDNGPGIPAEALPHVFERFYRADPSRSRESGGSGLGLAIARRLVMLHNGRIWIESQPGQLTSIYVALPKI
jgi:signal transduction histidine kinase